MSIGNLRIKLSSLVSQFEVEIYSRRQYILQRTAAWEDTEKGAKYISDTEWLQPLKDQLKKLDDELEDMINE